MATITIGRELDSSTDSVEVVQGTDPWNVAEQNQLVPEVYDYIALSYTSGNLTGVVYKTGGSGGTTVATLVLTYSGDDLVTVTRT